MQLKFHQSVKSGTPQRITRVRESVHSYIHSIIQTRHKTSQINYYLNIKQSRVKYLRWSVLKLIACLQYFYGDRAIRSRNKGYTIASPRAGLP